MLHGLVTLVKTAVTMHNTKNSFLKVLNVFTVKKCFNKIY